MRSTGESSYDGLKFRVCLLVTYVCRPFKIVAKPDGRPAVEVENAGKRQQFVCSFTISV